MVSCRKLTKFSLIYDVDIRKLSIEQHIHVTILVEHAHPLGVIFNIDFI